MLAPGLLNVVDEADVMDALPPNGNCVDAADGEEVAKGSATEARGAGDVGAAKLEP